MSVARHTAYNILGSLAPVAVSLIAVPLYLKLIGLERYGILALCWAMLGYMGFLNLGLGPALSRQIATLKSAPAEERANVFWTALWLNIGMGVVGGLLLAALASLYFDSMKDLEGGLRAELDAAIPLLACIIPITMLSGVLTGALQGREQFGKVNMITAGMSTLMTLSSLAVAYLSGPHMVGLIGAALAVRCTSLLLLLRLCVREVPLKGVRGVDRALIRPLLSFGGWVTASTLIAPLVVTIDRFAIGTFIGAAAVSIYTVPYNLVNRITVIPQGLQGALFPRFAYLDRERGRKLQEDALGALSTVMTPLVIATVIALGPFLIVWIGKDLASQSAPVAYILLIGWWANSYARVPNTFLQAQGRPDLMTKVLLTYLVPYTLLLAFALKQWGVVGAAVAWSARSLSDPICFLALTKQTRLLPRLILPGLFVCAAVATALWLPIDTPLRWGLHVAILGTATLHAVWRMPTVLWDKLEALTRRLPLRELLGPQVVRVRRLTGHDRGC